MVRRRPRRVQSEGVGRKLSQRYFYVTYLPATGGPAYYMVVSVLEGSRYGSRRLVGKWGFPTTVGGQASISDFIKALKKLAKEKEEKGERLTFEEVDAMARSLGGMNVDVRALVEMIRKKEEGEYAEMWRRMLRRAAEA